VNHQSHYWTVNETLDYIADLYPQGRRAALNAIRLAAQRGRVRITGCPCKWDNYFRATEVGAREVIRDLDWVDYTFALRGGDWAAVWQESSRYTLSPDVSKTLPPALARLLVDKRSYVPRTPIGSESSQAAGGWCRLQVQRQDVYPAFPLPPNVEENLRRFVREAGVLSAPAGSGAQHAFRQTGGRSRACLPCRSGGIIP